MRKTTRKRILALVMSMVMIVTSLAVMPMGILATAAPGVDILMTEHITPDYGFIQDSTWASDQDSRELLEHNILTSTMTGSVGMQGFEGRYAIDNPNEIVEIVVQFVTPPYVALRLMQEREISTQPLGRTLPGASLEEQALSAHEVFGQQLAQIPMPFGRNNQFEIFSEHHRLFNGVFMRVPGYMVEIIAGLDEVFVVTPNVTFYPLPVYISADGVQDHLFLPDSHSVSETLLTAPAIGPINPNLMRGARELFDMDYIHNVMGITGAGVRVAVIDSGIEHEHPEFERFLDETGRIRGGDRFDNSPSDNPADWARSHGTAVSGSLIAMAPDIELWNYRIHLGGIGPGLHPVRAVEYAHMDGMDVINMSFGGPAGIGTPISAAVNLAVLDGIVAVSAVGNIIPPHWTSRPMDPGSASLGIGVGSGRTGSDIAENCVDRLSDFSVRGPAHISYHIKPDIIAPGDLVFTTYLSVYGGYHIVSGTSFAAPVVAGIAALLIERFPDAPPYEIKAKMMNTARPLAEHDPNSVFAVGAGFVQPLEALRAETVVTTRHYVPLEANLMMPFEMATMASLSFGIVGEGMSASIPINIKNIGTDSRTYIISYEFNHNPESAASFNLSETSIEVDPGGMGRIITNIFIGNNAPRGSLYEGYVYIRDMASDSLIARLPFGTYFCFLAEEPWIIEVSTETELRSAVMLDPSQFRATAIIIYLMEDITIELQRTVLIFSGARTTLRSAGEDMRTITATGNFDVITVSPFSHLTVDGVNITRIEGTAGHGILNNYGIAFGISDVAGQGRLTMLGGIISGHSGAGVMNHGFFEMKGGEISWNTASGRDVAGSGGGVRNIRAGSNSRNSGVFNMHGGEIRNNSTPFSGGGVSSNGVFNMYGGSIYDNTALAYGGGVQNEFGTLNMFGGIISGNKAHANGGGVSSAHGGDMSDEWREFIKTILGGSLGAFNMHGGEISGNAAAINGGGIGIHINDLRDGRLRIGHDAVFSGNTASAARNRLAIDDTVYYKYIHGTAWTNPFTQGFNNFDIAYDVGDIQRHLTLHLYDNTNSYITIPVELYSPLCPIALTPIIALMEDDNHMAFWGWFTDEQLNNSGRTRNNHRRPTVGDEGFNINTILTTELFNSLATNGNIDLYAIWVRWGDVNDDGVVNGTDVNLMSHYVARFPGVVLVRPAAKVTRGGTITGSDVNLMSHYVARVPGVVIPVPR